MKDLTLRLSALDPEAGAALRAITYLDTLAATHPGLSAVLRGAVTLTGAAAGIIDAHHHLTLRIDEHGRTQHHPGPPARLGEDAAAEGPDGHDHAGAPVEHERADAGAPGGERTASGRGQAQSLPGVGLGCGHGREPTATL